MNGDSPKATATQKQKDICFVYTPNYTEWTRNLLQQQQQQKETK